MSFQRHIPITCPSPYSWAALEFLTLLISLLIHSLRNGPFPEWMEKRLPWCPCSTSVPTCTMFCRNNFGWLFSWLLVGRNHGAVPSESWVRSMLRLGPRLLDDLEPCLCFRSGFPLPSPCPQGEDIRWHQARNLTFPGAMARGSWATVALLYPLQMGILGTIMVRHGQESAL